MAHRIGKSQLKNIEQQVHEYDVTLTKIVPMDIKHGNDTIREEISHLLTNRSWLHEQFASLGTNGKIAPLWQQVQQLDKIFIKQRSMILDHVLDYYKQERQRLKMPREYWWWYLDELESVELPEWVMQQAKEVDVAPVSSNIEQNVQETRTAEVSSDGD